MPAALADVSGFSDRARRGFGISVKEQPLVNCGFRIAEWWRATSDAEGASLATPGNDPGLAEASSHDRPPLIIKSRGFLNPLRKRLSADPIYYNLHRKSCDISRPKASAASPYT